ncbi:putative N-acetyltransferase p20 [Camellia lanceoleosa]|uniref:N-acetyltransferase p20 n=1 Tax=Camellia lanceoleosa TaxID=1840588 RepID=A0ACC0HE10_9ERIC|nr:putative N-acetyltransferase p20 [Camellia lanceoleosa]
MENFPPKLVEKTEEEEEDELSNISLRLFDFSDVDDFMVWATDDKVIQFCSWDTDTYASKEAAMNYIANFVIPHPWYRAICLNGRPIGDIAVSPNRGNDSCRAEIGYVLGSNYWGRGIVTQAVKMAARSVFVEWPHLERLEALVDVENKGSQRVLEKSGFQREGVLRKYYLQKGRARDTVIFSLLSTDPLINSFMYS